MPKIKRLSPHVADLIAAGEVVERPSSVIKELIENSIDAGASSITVEIKNGGMTFMRVTDNGCGIAQEDAETAFLRYATSKLRDERGLEAIGTLGFRGEALAAIASVSRIELLTKESCAPHGTRLFLEGGQVAEKAEAGCPDGTTITVCDLFYNTPARLKFIKNDKAEGASISSVVLRSALSHPEVSVKYVKDGKEEFQTAGDSRADSCIYTLFGREFFSGLVNVAGESENISVKGYVSSPAHVRGNRSHQFFYLNGRYIKSKTLQAALEQAYKNSLFAGRFPSCILYLSIRPSAVDVNVHPTKTEVKFLNEREVFSAVYYAVLSALAQDEKKAEIHLSSSHNPSFSEPAGQAGAPPFRQRRFAGSLPKETGFSGSARIPSPFSSGSHFHTAIPAVSHRKDEERFLQDETRAVYQTKMNMPGAKGQSAALYGKEALTHEEETSPFRIVGEVFSTYLVVEQGENLFFIDKHAAHERILFDKLKQQKEDMMTQVLLTPVVCDMTSEEMACLLENRAFLRGLGFEIEEFGSSSIVVRQLPSDIETGNVRALMGELCEKLNAKNQEDILSMRDEVLHTIACKAAIKAGKRSEPDEIYHLVERVLAGEVKYCPHGRPVLTELTKTSLDKNFRRI